MRHFIIGLLLVAWTGVAVAAPSDLDVSGTVSTANTIVITGAGFGGHALEVESLSANIEAGTAGDTLSATNWIATAGGAVTVPPKYATDRRFSGTKSLKLIIPNYNGGFAYDIPNPIEAGDRFYASWWVYYDGPTAGTGAENTGQWKMMRVTKNHTVSDGFYQSLASNWFKYGYIAVDPGTTNQKTLWGSPPVAPNGWHRVEVDYIASSTGTANGKMTISVTNPSGSTSTDVNNAVITHVDAGAVWNYAFFQNYIGNGITNATIWYDDVYIQTGTPARVEVCTGDAWANKGKCEVQTPTEWSSTSISATASVGSFSSGATAYVYVVDSTGAANDLGYAVEIGASGGSTDTTPPVRSLLAPSGTLAAGTTSTTLSLTTNEAATCKYGTTAGVAYASMTNTFDTAYSMSHSATVSGLANGSSYTYYVRCIDGSGNANTTDSTISFSVASSAGTAGVLSWEQANYVVERSAGRIPINIIRTGGSTGTVTAQWSSNGQTARHNVDYYGADNVTVTFADGVTSVPINTYGIGQPDGIEMIDNGAPDDRYFQMILSNPTGGATLGTTLATVTIEGVPVVVPFVSRGTVVF